MLSGHLREKNNTYYAVLNCKHSDGKRYSKWVSTGIAVKKGNKRTAEKKLEEFCSTYDEYGRLPGEVPEVQLFRPIGTQCVMGVQSVRAKARRKLKCMSLRLAFLHKDRA